MEIPTKSGREKRRVWLSSIFYIYYRKIPGQNIFTYDDVSWPCPSVQLLFTPRDAFFNDVVCR